MHKPETTAPRLPQCPARPELNDAEPDEYGTSQDPYQTDVFDRLDEDLGDERDPYDTEYDQ
jgi:hypothetical protein